jgi:hypothetical protein
VNTYRASIATAVLSVVTLGHAQSMSRSSFSSSMIANAMSKFHGVKAVSKAPSATTAALVAPKSEAVAQAPIIRAEIKPQVSEPALSQVEVTPVVSTPVQAQVLPPAPASKAKASLPIPQSDDEAARDLRDLHISGPMADPNSIELEMPTPTIPVIDPTNGQAAEKKKLKLRWVSEGYFDAGYERLLGTFSTQIIRYGVRYGQDDLHAYFRNETLNTNGTGLPYPQAVTGTSVGLEARHWFPGNKMYAGVSYGEGIGGYNLRKADFRYGLVGYTNWTHNRWFSDLYGELYYIAVAADTFFDVRLRSGQKIHEDKKGYLWDYVVGQFWVSGQTESGTENRTELGLGIGYVYAQSISLNVELRGGYAFRSGIDNGGDRSYFNPTIILSGGWYKGFFY